MNNKLKRLILLLEGHNIERFYEVDKGIFRGALPPTIDDYYFLQSQHGIKTLLDLRESEETEEEQHVAKELGFEYINIPMNHFRVPSNAEQALEVLKDPSKHSIYFHCLYGKDRTGLVCALYRIRVQGWDKDRAQQEMMEYGFNPDNKVLVDYFNSVT